MMKIAIEGCCHGELDLIYRTISHSDPDVELLIICGDFQCVRDIYDLQCVAMPAKYRRLNTFHQYVSGEKVAPIMTIFVGGNHEASNILQSFYYGGYVATNIYFLGFAGVIEYKGIRIAGISGIYNPRHYKHGHYETPPYTEDSMRSVYHIRELEMYRMSHIKKHVDIFASHDWPAGIWEYGDKQALLRVKPYFRDDINTGKLGNPPFMKLLQSIKPDFWFAAHLHVKFEASYCHDTARSTSFVALDKAIPGRQFLHVIKIDNRGDNTNDTDNDIKFDLEWLSILHQTHDLLKTVKYNVSVPSSLCEINESLVEDIKKKMTTVYGDKLIIPNIITSQQNVSDIIICQESVNQGNNNKTNKQNQYQRAASSIVAPLGNEFTDTLLNTLGLSHIWTYPVSATNDYYSTAKKHVNSSSNNDNNTNNNRDSYNNNTRNNSSYQQMNRNCSYNSATNNSHSTNNENDEGIDQYKQNLFNLINSNSLLMGNNENDIVNVATLNYTNTSNTYIPQFNSGYNYNSLNFETFGYNFQYDKQQQMNNEPMYQSSQKQQHSKRKLSSPSNNINFVSNLHSDPNELPVDTDDDNKPIVNNETKSIYTKDSIEITLDDDIEDDGQNEKEVVNNKDGASKVTGSNNGDQSKLHDAQEIDIDI